MRLFHLLRKEIQYYLRRLRPNAAKDFRPSKTSTILRTRQGSHDKALPTQMPPPRRRILKVILWSLISISVLMVLAICFFISAVQRGNFGVLPTTAELQNIQNYNASEIYDHQEKLLGKYFIENRADIAYEDIAPAVIHALVATEDARFFEHEGIDYRAMLRVLWKSILQQQATSGGGSTLSQQLAKNLYPRTYEYGPFS
ncbi:MAG: transglycosylase domain-containing protein, partial [Bacteroidota bacterium]